MVCGLDVVETVRSYTGFGAVICDNMIQVTIRSIKLMGCSSLFGSSVAPLLIFWDTVITAFREVKCIFSVRVV
jgi:hypothetical protein